MEKGKRGQRYDAFKREASPLVVDQYGTVRSVGPEAGGPKVHYICDAEGHYIGKR